MSRIKEDTAPKKQRVTFRVMMAAAIIVALAVSAFASDVLWGAGYVLKDVLQDKNGTVQEDQIELMNEIGKVYTGPGVQAEEPTEPEEITEPDQPHGALGAVTSNGTTMTPIAAIADEEVLYLYLRIEAPVGTILRELDKDADGCYQLFAPDHYTYVEAPEHAYDVSKGSYLDKIGVYWTFEWLPDDDVTDNKIEVIVKMVKTNGVFEFNDDVEKWVTFHGLWVQSPNNEYTQILDGTFSFDVSIPYESNAITVLCDNVSVYDPEADCIVTFDSIRISSLSMRIISHYTEVDRTKWAPGFDVQVYLKDGTMLPIALGNSSDYLSECRLESQYTFDCPVSPAQIDYLLVNGDQKIFITES